MAFAGPIWGRGLSSLLCCCPAIAQIKRGKRGGAGYGLLLGRFAASSARREASSGLWATGNAFTGSPPSVMPQVASPMTGRPTRRARANQQDVTALTERGGQSDAEVRIAGGTVASREQADRLASGCLCASAHRGHGPEPSAADHDGASLGEASTERLRDRDQRGIRIGRGGHTDVDAHSAPRFPARLRTLRTAEPPSDAVLAEASAPAGVEAAKPSRGAPAASPGVEGAAERSRGDPVVAAGPSCGGAGGAAVVRSIRSWSRRRMAPALSRGWLPLPHLGDWTQEGQPVSQGQDLMVSLVARRCSAVSS